MRTSIRVVAAAVLMIVLSLAGAAAASAHAVLLSSDPVENTSLPTNPERVSATFNEQMQAEFAAMTVIGPDGGQYSDGDVAVAGATLSVGVRPGGPAGTYTVNYRGTSADGHVVSGAWSYSITESRPAVPVVSPSPVATPTVAPTAAPPAPADGGMPLWPFIVGASVIVAAGTIWAVRRRS
jgi:methionine-rich copper-binding protein CopC